MRGSFQNFVQVAGFERPGFQGRALMHGAGGQQPVDGSGILGFHPDSGQKFWTQGFDGPGGQDRPAQFAAGIGQGGLDGMKAIKPLSPPTLALWGLSGMGRSRAFSPGFPRFFVGSGRRSFAEGFGAHGALIKKWGPRVKPMAAKIQPFCGFGNGG